MWLIDVVDLVAYDRRFRREHRSPLISRDTANLRCGLGILSVGAHDQAIENDHGKQPLRPYRSRWTGNSELVATEALRYILFAIGVGAQNAL